MTRYSDSLKLTSDETKQWIESMLTERVHDIYRCWARRARAYKDDGLDLPPEPVLTVAVLTDELEQYVGPQEWRRSFRKYRHYAVELACRRLTTRGVLRCSIAFCPTRGREVRAYECGEKIE